MSEYRTIDLNAWTLLGEGSKGRTYKNPSEPDQLLKVYKQPLNALESVKRTFDVSKAVEGLGLQTPKMYEIVRVGDGYATICQLIKKKRSLARICCAEFLRTEEIGQLLCEKGKELFSIPCKTDIFPNRKEQLMSALEKVRFIGKKNRQILQAYARTIPDCTTCLHGEFDMGNIIQSEGQLYWIDLDRFGYGDPMFDIGHLYLICNIYAPRKRIQEIYHMSENQFHRFWDAFAKAYVGKDDHAAFDHLAGKFACLDIVLGYEFQKQSLLKKIFCAKHIRRLIKAFYLN